MHWPHKVLGLDSTGSHVLTVSEEILGPKREEAGAVYELTRKKIRHGIFDDWEVYGIQYEFPDGNIAWRIVTDPSRSPVKDYWVTDGEIFDVSIHLAHNAAGDTLINTFGRTTDIGEEERSSILQAIAAWEAE